LLLEIRAGWKGIEADVDGGAKTAVANDIGPTAVGVG